MLVQIRLLCDVDQWLRTQQLDRRACSWTRRDHDQNTEVTVGDAPTLANGFTFLVLIAQTFTFTSLQSAGSLKVTIQQSSESREFGPTDRTADRQMGGLRCHVCNLTCRSLQVFQEHVSGQDHMTKLQEITNGIHLNTHTTLDRGRRPQPQRWCDTCQTHFGGDVIVHRRTKQHKVCKQLSRPFCPVCKRHFRTPRKFVEHMKSEEHKQQVHLEESLDEELITVDAVGCFEEEGEDETEVADEEQEQENEGEEESKTTESEVGSGSVFRFWKHLHRNLSQI
ncbi:cdkn1a interacting zinc finger protein 1b [Xenentodon cancila]